jgi:aspartokinase-like uncharacterized kinase
MTPSIVKVGGSLFDMPDLVARLTRWLKALRASRIVLVPGGGAAANVVRKLDDTHELGDAVSHVLALKAMTLNAWFLAELLGRAGGTPVPVLDPLAVNLEERVSILDAHAFWVNDEKNDPGALPATWKFTSDSLAARVAVVLGARELVLLKSVSIPDKLSWQEAGRQGFVDPLFARLARPIPHVRAVNLREMSLAS